MVQTVVPAQDARVGSRGRTDIALIDSDVHNYVNNIDELVPYLSERWRVYIRQSGFASPPGNEYPKGFELASRRDSWPPSGKRPGGDPDFAREQLLDTWNIDYAILNPLYGHAKVHNVDFALALMRAVNEWTSTDWLAADPRWRGSISVSPQDPAASAAEIRRVAKDSRYVQILLTVRADAPYGRRQFHPIFEAACDVDLPVGIHFGGWGSQPITATGWPSFYIEDHTGMVQAFEAQVISLVCEGVFERFPSLRIALVEGGFAWLPALMWRLDKNYKALRDEVPWLTKLPSEYIREHFRATTQPMEEPDDPRHLVQLFDMIGRDDFLMFATDYPHWDFDAPDRALPSIVPDNLRRRIMAGNATAFYDFARA